MRRFLWNLLDALLRFFWDVAALLRLPRPPIWKQDFVRIDRRIRSFILIVPPHRRLPGRRFPIVMALHGGQGNARRMVRLTGLGERVESDGFLAVFPDSGGKPWNDGRETTRSGPDDVAFLLAVLRRVADNHFGDPERAFVVGISNGGMMAQRLACQTKGVFKAYASVVANLPALLAQEVDAPPPVPILMVNGTEDPLMPFAGGDLTGGPTGRGAGGRVLSTPDTVGFWASAGGCRGQSAVALPDTADDGTKVILHHFEDCSAGGEVRFYEVVGGGHARPGGLEPKRPGLRKLLGNVSRNIDTTAVAIDFFRKYGL